MQSRPPDPRGSPTAGWQQMVDQLLAGRAPNGRVQIQLGASRGLRALGAGPRHLPPVGEHRRLEDACVLDHQGALDLQGAGPGHGWPGWAVGQNDHAPGEYVDLESLPVLIKRTALPMYRLQ
jgi:hypothetical protein